MAGEPNYSNAGVGNSRANNHQKHVGSAAAATCVYCHGGVVVTSGTAIVASSTLHVNRTIEVAQGGGKSFTWTAGTKTCSNINCHGSGSPASVWGAVFGCADCHGGNAGSGKPITTGKHTHHINQAAVLGINLGCVACHANTVSNDTTISNSAKHADGFNNFSGVWAGKNKATCNAAYCHTDGKGIFGTAVDWTTGPALACVGCHGTATGGGTFVSQAGEPNYSSAGAGVFRANSHQSHTTGLTQKGAASCEICHFSTVATSGTAIQATGLHINQAIDVTFNTSKAGATAGYNTATRTCNTISCHGGGSPRWGDPASAGCTSCHGSLSATHAKHIGDLISAGIVTMYNYTTNKSSGTVYRFGCANCHPTDVVHHRDGHVDLTINKNKAGANSLTQKNLATTDGITATDTTSGITGTAGSDVSCKLAYCHSNGKAVTLVQADFRATPNWYNGTFGANRCGGCHENPPQYAGQSHYVAQSSMGNNGTAPYKESGHMIGIHFRNNSKGGNLTGFLGFSSSGSKAHGNAGVATTIGCAICHDGIASGTVIDTYAMTGTSSNFRCAACHTGSTRTKLQAGQITNTALHINGSKNVAFAPIEFRTKAQLSNVANAQGWTRPSGYKADGSYDSFDLSVSTWNAGNKTCMTACHVNQPNIIWGAQLQCFSCHANQ